MSHALGIDLGTTATKAVVIDAGGSVLAEAERPSELISLRAGWAEEDTERWWNNVCEVCRELPTAQVRAVGVSGMVPAVIPLDRGMRALRPRSCRTTPARTVRSPSWPGGSTTRTCWSARAPH